MTYKIQHRQKKAIRFDGVNDKLAYTPSGAGVANLDMKPNEAFSMSLWTKQIGTGGDSNCMQRWNVGSGGIAFGFYAAVSWSGQSWVDTLGVLMTSEGGAAAITLSSEAGTGARTTLRETNNWVHICFTYDGTGTAAGLKLFANGIDVTAAQVLHNGTAAQFIDYAAGARIGTGADLQIGTDSGSGTKEACYCQVAVHSIALTATQVAEIYSGGTQNYRPGPCDLTQLSTSSSLVGYWLGDGSSDTVSTIQDLSGNSFDMTGSNFSAGALMPCRIY
tara:strand:+ start:747 stop:1574 length:828 start_codon:yes stop_codon:yes gene_type:complete